MSEVTPPGAVPPQNEGQNPFKGIGKKPKSWGKDDSHIDAAGKNFGTDPNWFNNFSEKQRKQFLSNLSQSISAQMKQQQQQEDKARRRLKAAEEGKDPSDVN